MSMSTRNESENEVENHMNAKESEEKARNAWRRVESLPQEVLEKLAFAAEFINLVEKHSSGEEKKPA